MAASVAWLVDREPCFAGTRAKISGKSVDESATDDFSAAAPSQSGAPNGLAGQYAIRPLAD